MVSEIKGSGLSTIAQTQAATDAAVRKTNESSAAAAPRASGEVVTLTDLASRLQRLTESVANLPEVDQAKVEALRSEIESGTYAIDEQQIAEKLSAFESLLGSPPQA